MPDRHTVSCEPCKRKKCKCDRKLPCCTQCSTLPSFCKYHENNKRGIPTGYLNALEQRLNETEDALYNSLADLRELRTQFDHERPSRSREVVSISSRPANETKASRMEEWKRFPVKEPRDWESWWLGVVDGTDVNHMIQDHSPETKSNNSQYQDFRPGSSNGSVVAGDSMAREHGEAVINTLAKSTQLVREMNHVYY